MGKGKGKKEKREKERKGKGKRKRGKGKGSGAAQPSAGAAPRRPAPTRLRTQGREPHTERQCLRAAGHAVRLGAVTGADGRAARPAPSAR